MNRILLASTLLTTAGALFLSSCSNNPDFYNPNQKTTEYAASWERQFGSIDPNQNWNVATSKKANMSIQGDALAQYTLQLFTANPLYDADAELMASYDVETDAQGKASVSFDFDILSTAKEVYAVSMDAGNRRTVKPVDVTDEGVNVTFGAAESTAKAKTRAAIQEHDLPTMSCPYSESEVNSMIAKSYDICQGLNYPNPYNPSAADMEISSIAYGQLNTLINAKGNGYILNTVKITGKFDKNLYIGDYQASTGTNKIIVADGAVYSPIGTWAGVDVIVAKGGTLDLTSQNKVYLGQNSRLIVMPGGKVIDNNPGREPEPDKYSINFQGALIYNAGTMDVPVISLNNGTSSISSLYNADGGVINSDYIIFQNDQTVLTNQGHITTNYVTGNGNQGTLNNACNLVVKEEFMINYLNLGANSEIRTKKMNFQGGATLRENSILRCDNFYSNLSTFDYVGASDGAALISTKYVEFVNVGEDGRYFQLNGRIYFEADDINGDENGSKQKTVENAAKKALGLTKVGEANYTIPAGDCTGEGNTPQTPSKPTVKAQTWIIACEDLGNTDDIDFNDIVFSVSHAAGQTTATVTPLAAGGTLPAYVYHDTENLGEIHYLINGSQASGSRYPMLNTQNGRGTAGKPITINVDADYSLAPNSTSMGGFMIKVEDSKEAITITGGQVGEAPQMILVPGNWLWPTERTSIKTAYGYFVDWSQSANSYTDWYNYPTDGKVAR